MKTLIRNCLIFRSCERKLTKIIVGLIKWCKWKIMFRRVKLRLLRNQSFNFQTKRRKNKNWKRWSRLNQTFTRKIREMRWLSNSIMICQIQFKMSKHSKSRFRYLFHSNNTSSLPSNNNNLCRRKRNNKTSCILISYSKDNIYCNNNSNVKVNSSRKLMSLGDYSRWKIIIWGFHSRRKICPNSNSDKIRSLKRSSRWCLWKMKKTKCWWIWISWGPTTRYKKLPIPIGVITKTLIFRKWLSRSWDFWRVRIVAVRRMKMLLIVLGSASPISPSNQAEVSKAKEIRSQNQNKKSTAYLLKWSKSGKSCLRDFCTRSRGNFSSLLVSLEKIRCLKRLRMPRKWSRRCRTSQEAS